MNSTSTSNEKNVQNPDWIKFNYKLIILRENFIQKKLQFLYNSLTLNELDAVYPVSNYLNWISSANVAQNSTLITVMLKQV